MVKTQDIEFAKLFTGNILFYDLRTRRNRLFLHRNLRRFLDCHQRGLQQIDFSFSFEVPESTSKADALTFPTLETLYSMEEDSYFLVKFKGIRPMKENDEADFTAVSPSKKKTEDFTLKCQLFVTIWNSENGKVVKIKDGDTLSSNSTPWGFITAVQTARGNKAFQIDIKPHQVPLHTLRTKIPGRSANWKRGVAPKEYSIHISLNFEDNEETELFYKHLRPQGLPTSRVVAKWDDMAVLPASDQLIPLMVREDTRWKNLGYGLEVDMSWVRAGGTPMEVWNRRRKKSKHISQLPSPVSEPGLQERLRIKFTYRKGKPVLSRDGSCPHCQDRWATFDTFFHHLKTSHDVFEFTLVKKEETRSGEFVVVEANFESKVCDRYGEFRASDRAPDAKDATVVAPQRPFDLKAYLKGDNSWVASATLEKQRSGVQKSANANNSMVKPKAPNQIISAPQNERKKFKVPRAPIGVKYFRTVTKRPLEEGELVSESDDDVDMTWLNQRRERGSSDSDLPVPARRFMKKWDEHIYEERLCGDVHVGDAIVRFATDKCGWLRDHAVTDEFRRKATELRDDDIITEDVYLRCMDIIKKRPRKRSRPESLQHEKMGLHSTPPHTPLVTSTDENEGDVLTMASKFARKGKLSGQHRGGRPTGAEVEHRRQAHNKRARTESRQSSPSNDVEMEDASDTVTNGLPMDNLVDDTPPFDRCICGEHAESENTASKLVWCENHDCVRHCFHIACVAEQWNETPDPRQYIWLCPDCRATET